MAVSRSLIIRRVGENDSVHSADRKPEEQRGSSQAGDLPERPTFKDITDSLAAA
jgi:hypothetical protein